MSSSTAKNTLGVVALCEEETVFSYGYTGDSPKSLR